MKKYLALLLAVLMLAAVFAGCASKETTTDTPAASTETAEPAKTEDSKPEATKTEEPAEGPAAEEGKVFNIYAWNEEFKGFFEKYYTVPEGVTVNWIITPSADGAYQDKLDEALLNQENASADDKVDLILAEADYIQKYTESPVTQDITALGVTDFSNTYAYTVQAASDASGVVKGRFLPVLPGGPHLPPLHRQGRSGHRRSRRGPGTAEQLGQIQCCRG